MRYLLCAAPLLLALSPTPPSDPTPVVLAPYTHDGAFDPGDYRWLRGMFDGATATEKAADAAIVAWRSRCRARDLAQTRTELSAIGIAAGRSLDSIPYRTLLCNQISNLPEPLNLHDWDGFARDVAIVQPIAQGFFAGVVLAERGAEPRTPALADQLIGRATGEQILRRGLDWAMGSDDGPRLTLTEQQRGILVSRIAMAMAERDHTNTEWLKAIVASQGWPSRAKVGEGAAQVAWLLVQHADADPAFQLRALRLMEPLVASAEVNPKNYAYLYDRVMLKLVGKQRYASQLTCHGGHWVPDTIEDASKVDAWRAKTGMVSLADYLRQANKDRGTCTEIPQ